MRFHLFEQHADAHVRKSREYLEEANLGRVEHQAAAEHHAALAKMYAARIARIEAEISSALQPRSMLTPLPEEERSRPDSVVAYPSKSARS